MRHATLVAAACLGLTTLACAQDKDKAAAAKQEPGVQRLQELMKEFGSMQEKAQEAMETARTPQDREKVVANIRKQFDGLAKKFADLADKHPKSDVAFDALNWLVLTGVPGPEGEKAAKTLLADHARYFKVLAKNLTDSEVPAAESILRSIADHKDSDAAGKAQATFAIAKRTKAKADAPDQKPADADKLRAEAEASLDKVVKDFADQKDVVEEAKSELFELRHLQVGKEAPEIAGEDGDGKPMKLSDFRGKVVVVDFWASWCGPCMGMVPHNRELVKRLEGQPFAFLGVNADASRPQQQRAEKQAKINYRSWTDGQNGPISQAWRIQFLPTVYVLDHKGIIRHKGIGGGKEKELDATIETLVKAASAKP
jgi:thiol-disulfide isomerase/thioredoxin